MFMSCKLNVAYGKLSVSSVIYFITRNLLVEKDKQFVCVCVCVCAHACTHLCVRMYDGESHDSMTVIFLESNCSSSKSFDLCA